MPRYRWTILAVGVGTTGAISALRQGLPSLGPFLRDEFGLSLPQTGLALASVTLGIVVTLLAWGVLTDRVGERLVLALGLTGAAGALAAAAFAPGFTSLLAGLVAAGMLGASATNASGRAVMGWFGRGERGMALGVRQMGVPLGGAVAAVTLPVLANQYGLRGALLALAAVCLLGAMASAHWMREPPPPTRPRPPVDAPPPTRDRRLWRLGTGGALLVAGQSGILAFVVIFLHEERGVSVTGAAAVLAALMVAGALARVVAGRWSDRVDSRIVPLRRLGGAAALWLAAVALLVEAPMFLLLPALMVAGVLAMSWNGLSFTAAAEMSGRVRAGTAIGVQNTLLSIAGVIAPVAFGTVVAVASWEAAYAMLAAGQLLGWWVLRPLVAEEAARRARREAWLDRHAAESSVAGSPARRTCNASEAGIGTAGPTVSQATPSEAR